MFLFLSQCEFKNLENTYLENIIALKVNGSRPQHLESKFVFSYTIDIGHLNWQFFNWKLFEIEREKWKLISLPAHFDYIEIVNSNTKTSLYLVWITDMYTSFKYRHKNHPLRCNVDRFPFEHCLNISINSSGESTSFIFAENLKNLEKRTFPTYNYIFGLELISWHQAFRWCREADHSLPHFMYRDELIEFTALLFLNVELQLITQVFIGLVQHKVGAKPCSCFC